MADRTNINPDPDLMAYVESDGDQHTSFLHGVAGQPKESRELAYHDLAVRLSDELLEHLRQAKAAAAKPGKHIAQRQGPKPNFGERNKPR